MSGVACRGCGESALTVVLDLGEMPLANRLLTESDLQGPEPRFPLALSFCGVCCLPQITETVPPETLFRDYAYFSSVSQAMVEHARKLALELLAARALGAESLVVEVASNDGYLLQHYASAGVPVLGIDPARNIADAATARGVPTLPEFFGTELAETLRRSGQLADVIHANNVLAHVPAINDFVAGLAAILKPGGLIVVETPYVRDLVERLEFDTIYHEHVFYYSLSALVRIFARHRLAVTDVQRIPIHGGSLRVFATHAADGQRSAATRELLHEEANLGMCSVEFFDGFAARVDQLKGDLVADLAARKASGTSIAAYGAAAKGAVLLNAFGIGRETIDYVVDRSPHKQGRYMPGVRIPIRPAEDLARLQPDVCLLLAWNLADEILGQQMSYRAAGGTFLIPGSVLRTV